MSLGGNSEGNPSEPNPGGPIDRWEGLLEQIADDVSHIRQLVTMAWWAAWIVLAMVIVLVILLS